MSSLQVFCDWLRSEKPDAVVMSLGSWQSIGRGVDKLSQFSNVTTPDGSTILSPDEVMVSYGYKQVEGGDWFRPQSVNSFEGIPVAVYESESEYQQEYDRVSHYGRVSRYEP
jgi:hypothetical protein